MAGLLTKGATLSYSKTGDSYTKIDNLQSFPSLAGTPERVDVTTLEDGNRHYIQGIKDFDELAFVFLYDNSTATSNYRVAHGLEDDGILYWQFTFPDGTKFKFSGECAAGINEGGVNDPITFNLTITLNSDIEVVDPE